MLMNFAVDLIGVPFDLGGGRSGARYGPDSFARSCLPQELSRVGFASRYYDLGAKWGIVEAFNTLRTPSGLVHYEREVAQMAKIVSARTVATILAGRFPVVLGGDHSISIGSIGGALHSSVLSGRKLGLVWIDAHLDAHTHLTTPSHRAHGLPLATLLGYGPKRLVECANAVTYGVDKGRRKRIGTTLSPLHVIHIGAGEDHCEPEEYAFFEKHSIPQFSRKHLRQEGWSALYSSLQEICDSVDLLWVSLDLDSIDRSIAPGVYYPNPNGLRREEVLELAAVIAASGKLCGVDLMEYNPQFEQLDKDGNPITVRTATEFLLRLLGK